jgi:hypothetical protein
VAQISAAQPMRAAMPFSFFDGAISVKVVATKE